MLRFEPYFDENAALTKRIAKENGISELLASLLINRGICEREEIAAFLHPGPEQLFDPFLLDGMQAAVARIQKALEQKERICVYGDYDADGVCATAMLATYLRAQGADVQHYLPSRHTEGYGMNAEALKTVASRGVGLIITVDNGIAAKEEVALCYELGMEVIVTDHHQCPEELPKCIAVINPHRSGCAYPNPDLCGAGVALKLIQALGATQEQLNEYLPLAALATVADIVPLRGENRAIVSMGMPLVPNHMGLKELLAVSGSAGQEVTSETLAFRLAPRINAAGRMGDAERALYLLLAEDESQARPLALVLNDENECRQDEERGILLEARRMLQGKNVAAMRAIILYSPNWSPGVIGIVASKLVEEYYRPVLLFHLGDGMLTGSCRSIPGVHLYEALRAFGGMFLRFGGHAQAAGLTMEFEKFHEFCVAFDAYLRNTYPASVFVPSAKYECTLNLSQLTLQTAQELSLLAPYGEGNPQPVFLAKDVGLEDVETMGRDGAHLRANAEQEGRLIRLVAFGKGKESRLYMSGGRFNILYTPEANVWQQRARLQLMLRAIKPVSPFESPRRIANGTLKFYDAFFRNFLYNDICGAQAVFVEDMDKALIRALETELEGTLVLCLTPAGALRLKSLLDANALTDLADVYFHRLPEGQGTANAVLLAPYFTGEPFVHARIFVYDGHMSYAPALKFPGSAYVPMDSQADTLLAPLSLSRTEMGYLYQAFLSRLKLGAVPRWELISLPALPGREAAMMALLVFIELGFFQWDAKEDTVSASAGAAPRSLFDSRLYSAANIS